MERMTAGAAFQSLPAERRDAEVARLDDPWIAGEGPLDVGFRRGAAGPLRQRGIAFDATATVAWDEAGVQVVRAGEPDPDVVALTSPVLLHPRFQQDGPQRLVRVDYLCRGALLGSRYIAEGGAGA
jgi:hypothetical protein